MESERSNRIAAVLSAALALSPPDRSAFIAQACRGDAALERELRALLDSHGETRAILDPAGETGVRPGSGQHAGTLVGARYRLGATIGHGGMGVVYRAMDEQLHRPAAVKILPEAVRGDLDRLARFRNEARALAALNNPHIITIFEVGETGAAPFIAMDVVEGETLRARLERGPLPMRDALDIALQIARALSAAHDKRIVHRDIKPENVMIRSDGYVKVLDFGLASLRPALASDRSALTAGAFETVTAGVAGTPAYMSPEQIEAGAIDARTDIFSLGIVLCEALTGANPFLRPGVLETIAAIGQTPPLATMTTLPPAIRAIVLRTLQKAPADRYPSAAALAVDLQAVRASLDAPSVAPRRTRTLVAIAATLAFAATATVAGFVYRGSERRHWVLEQAIPEITRLAGAEKSAAAIALIDTAEQYLPGDADLAHAVAAATRVATIHSSPAGALVEVKDYLDPKEPWLRLGVTPLDKVRIPRGYLRWKISKAGVGESITAPFTGASMNFDLQAAAAAPSGMVPVRADDSWFDVPAFLGAVGPYKLPAFDVDRLEVTNRQYQAFVDKGGYENRAYWTQPFVRDGQTLGSAEAMDLFRDQTRRPGPATWEAGHYPVGKADYPVSGVSWYEAAAYAAFAGKSLPVLAQDLKLAAAGFDKYVVQFSNLSNNLEKAGQFEGRGPFGTSDLVGNAREWTWNSTPGGLRYLLGRQAASYGPELLSPFDRSPLDGFRCVRNAGPIPAEALAPRKMLQRDFSKATPVSDDVFRVYRSMYAYGHTPLHASVEDVADPGRDWIKQKVTFDAAYGRERVTAFLFLPKNARPPFETVVFFPSARVNFETDSARLGDLTFMDYVVQSGRAVMYPIYEGLYERRSTASPFPAPELLRDLMFAWSKDLGRSIDYLATRPDIDVSRLGYLGVSQGSAWGVILAAIETRLKAVVFLDGGFFQWTPKVPGMDQVDFAPRVRVPVLMVNGRYDATFPYLTAQVPLFKMLGTPAADKSEVTFETPHDVTQERAGLIKNVLAWYDKYLGPVR